MFYIPLSASVLCARERRSKDIRMALNIRPRRLIRAALTVALVAFVAACAKDHPDSIFHSRTEFNRDVGHLFNILIWAGSAVFVIVEVVLLYTLFRFRHRAGQRPPEQVHGNATLEILWTIIPALILVIIAVPTVQTIFRTQSNPPADALQVDVIGHQWWWEFRYPQYNVVTANELYLPHGRTVNFTLKTQDVIHSFWIAALGGKRDLVSNHTNHLWFTPDSAQRDAYNGVCAEYCGASHANMRFRTFVVAPQEFESWAQHQASPSTFTPPAPAQTAATPANTTRPAAPGGARTTATAPNAAPAATTPVLQAGFVAFPLDSIKPYAIPNTPTPSGLAFNESLVGDASRGAQLLSQGQGGCLACHTIKGNPSMIGQIGPNLTHVGSRATIAAGLFPNDTKHLALWIKNARAMKPGVVMPTLGLNEYDPILKNRMTAGLNDQQIADIVAYLQSLR
jgi:cytochrome c oxidase subunit II